MLSVMTLNVGALVVEPGDNPIGGLRHLVEAEEMARQVAAIAAWWAKSPVRA